MSATYEGKKKAPERALVYSHHEARLNKSCLA